MIRSRRRGKGRRGSYQQKEGLMNDGPHLPVRMEGFRETDNTGRALRISLCIWFTVAWETQKRGKKRVVVFG